MVPRLIAIDLDGTLLGPTGRVSPRNARALELAHEHGIEIVIATGRRHSYALGPLAGVNLCADNALISSNGSIIRSVSATELMHRSHMPLETARWLCEHAREFRSTLVVTFDTTQPGGSEARGALVCETAHDLDANINAWMNSNAPYIQHVDRIEDALTGDPPIQMMLCGPIERMRAAERHLAEHPRIAAPGEEPSAETEITLHRTEYPERDLSILDIVPVGISKASALERLGEIRGITPAQMMAIGDNWNDLAMLQFVGHPTVMANAPADLLQLAHHHNWHITPTNAEDGVAIAIEQTLGILVSA
jgi:hydroxymethylpyrimidine pyrophosphatase-like HAD family hydrolase